MNLYKLHTDAKNVLDDYKNMNDLSNASIKIVDDYGDIEYNNVFGQIHRTNGPAIITSGGTKFWCKHDMKHREDGPAVIYANGDTEYWINDNKISKNKFNERYM